MKSVGSVGDRNGLGEVGLYSGVRLSASSSREEMYIARDAVVIAQCCESVETGFSPHALLRNLIKKETFGDAVLVGSDAMSRTAVQSR